MSWTENDDGTITVDYGKLWCGKCQAAFWFPDAHRKLHESGDPRVAAMEAEAKAKETAK
jgi:hypothetical protein